MPPSLVAPLCAQQMKKGKEKDKKARSAAPEADVGGAGVYPVIGRTPAQEGGSSSSGGAAPSAPSEVVPERMPMPLDSESRKRSLDDRDESSKRKGGVVPAPKAAGQTKRRPEDQGIREKGRSCTETILAPTTAAAPDAEQMEDAPIPLNLKRERLGKRRASEEAKDEYQTGDEKKGPRLSHPDMDSIEVEDVLMNRLETEEKKTIHIATESYYIPMTVCEEAVDISWMESKKAKMHSEVIGCTDVGPVSDQLS